MNLSSLSLLVVEDDPFQQWTLQQHLLQMGVTAIGSAHNGALALEAVRARHFDVVVSDLDMPGMDGMEFMRRLSALPDAPAVIVISAQSRAILSSVETMAEAYGISVLGTIEKPATSTKLWSILDRYRPRAIEGNAARESRSWPASPRRIADAIAGGQFMPWFQPKVDVRTRRIVGAEALARWVQPSGEVVAAERFIAQVERCGLIAQLTDTIVTQACAACVEWRHAGVKAKLSFNMSLDPLSDPLVAEALSATVDSYGLAATELVIEVTESSAAGDLGAVLENLVRLRMRGFGLAIDDFGTGYATLQQLTRIPFSELKIDHSFVREAGARASCRAAVESSVAIARRLGLETVAEGVETMSDWELVRELGCDMAQGHMLGHAMPLQDFIARARRERR